MLLCFYGSPVLNAIFLGCQPAVRSHEAPVSAALEVYKKSPRFARGMFTNCEAMEEFSIPVTLEALLAVFARTVRSGLPVPTLQDPSDVVPGMVVYMVWITGPELMDEYAEELTSEDVEPLQVVSRNSGLSIGA
jgi:hypothetical protein